MQASVVIITNILKQYSVRKSCYKHYELDVICVLLLSGLQKEDLDANTLAKLRRHHVDINDMNNESLREECLKQSYLDNGMGTKTYEITEDPNDKTKISTQNQNEFLKQLTYSDDLNVEKQKPEIVAPDAYFVDKTNIRNIIEKENAQREQDKARMRSNDVNITMIDKGNEDQQNIFFKDQPSLESVMKFWVKMNEGNTKVTTEATTTYRPPPTKERIETTPSIIANLGDTRSNDMEYISKMIAEYIGKQTVPTTTQISPSSAKNMEIVSRTIKELLDRSSKTDSIRSPKNMENIFGKNLKEFSDITALAKLFQTYKNVEDRTEKALLKPQKLIYDDNLSGQIKRTEMKSYSSNNNFTPKVPNIESKRKKQALQYLNNMLQVNNNRLNGPKSFRGVDSQEWITINKDQDLYEKKQRDTKNESNNKDSGTVQNTNLVKDKLENVPVDVIKEIAEKVKEIVMRDIRKEIPTTERATTITTTTTTTTATSTTANPTVKVPNDSNVIQTLMDFFKEYKTMKDAIKGTTAVTMKLPYRNVLSGHIVPPAMDGFNPYVEKTLVTDLKRLEMNPYNQNLVPIPYGKISNPPHEPIRIPQTSFDRKIEYQMSPITIQTNSDEIPPLVIQVSKPMKAMNQHIIVTTQNPFEKQRDKKLHDENDKRLNSYKYAEPLHLVNDRNRLEENPTYADLTKKLRIAENVKQEFRESYKDKLQKIKIRIERNRDKSSDFNQLLHSNHGINLNGPLESKQHVSSSQGLNHHSGQPVNSNRHHYANREIDFNNHKTFDRQLDSHHREILNEPAEINNHESSNQPADSSYRDMITREFLRLVDSNHDVISKMVESSPYLRKPINIDRQSRNHQSDAYERYEQGSSHPRYKVTKFHEKLEQVDNRSANKYESYIKATTEGFCDTVAAREQMPLMKIKQLARFDDSHFKNFLKSQQKVTDMLEKILAAKTKAKTQSNEKR